MGAKTKIGWTDATWNPVTGCSKVSDGCKHCYAETMAWRLKGMGVARYRHGFDVRIHPKVLEEPVIPFFFKQWGGGLVGNELDGRTWEQFPMSG